jgi:hypothetical protein
VYVTTGAGKTTGNQIKAAIVAQWMRLEATMPRARRRGRGRIQNLGGRTNLLGAKAGAAAAAFRADASWRFRIIAGALASGPETTRPG